MGVVQPTRTARVFSVDCAFSWWFHDTLLLHASPPAPTTKYFLAFTFAYDDDEHDVELRWAIVHKRKKNGPCIFFSYVDRLIPYFFLKNSLAVFDLP